MSVLTGQRIVPLASPRDERETKALRDGLLDGGIGIVEIALRTPHAMTALASLSGESRLAVGAGTVLDAVHARASIDAGASFLVSPGLSEEVVAVAREHGVPVLPGVATASEVMRARALGLRTLKVFPANVLGGLRLLDAWHAVFDDIGFMPSGGVSQDSLAEHLAHPAVAAVSGSWMTSGALLAEGADVVAAAVHAARLAASQVPVARGAEPR